MWDEMINPSVRLLLRLRLRMQLRAREMFSLGNWKPSRPLRVWRKEASGSSSWMYLFSPYATKEKKGVGSIEKRRRSQCVHACRREMDGAHGVEGIRRTRWLFRFFFSSDRMFIQIVQSTVPTQPFGCCCLSNLTEYCLGYSITSSAAVVARECNQRHDK